MDETFHLSIVATSRNDNHGKNLAYRMQQFVNGAIEQCKRHNLKAELVLVEWNPPDETAPLAQALHYPKDKGLCCVRIIRVPKQAHHQLDHSDKIPLFQMIGKNVGIRRARGKFVLATNIDILFSDQLMTFIKKKLIKGCLYRVDRLDIPEMLPSTTSFDQTLKFCFRHFFRINGRCETTIVKRKINTDLRTRIKLFYTFIKQFNKFSYPTLAKCLRAILSISIMKIYIILRSILMFIWTFKRSTLDRILHNLKIIKKLICFFYPQNTLFLHTNACGDFTLLSLDDWQKLKGYPEWPMYSWHIDSVLLHQAKQHGIKFKNLSKCKHIYHIEHELGSGYSKEGAALLFGRLKAKGIPYLTDTDLKRLVTDMKQSKDKVIYNDDNWGMANLSLEEFIV